MTRWEYARLESTDAGVGVVFSHRQPWQRLAPEAFFDALRQLGDEGWELVSAMPLAAVATSAATEPGPAAPPAPAGPPGRDPRDARDARDLREPREPHPPPPGRRLSLRVGTDRWLIFKRPLPDEPPDQASAGADMLKGIVSRHVLKGRLPLP
jgi:hypothetical protein